MTEFVYDVTIASPNRLINDINNHPSNANGTDTKRNNPDINIITPHTINIQSLVSLLIKMLRS